MQNNINKTKYKVEVGYINLLDSPQIHKVLSHCPINIQNSPQIHKVLRDDYINLLDSPQIHQVLSHGYMQWSISL